MLGTSCLLLPSSLHPQPGGGVQGHEVSRKGEPPSLALSKEVFKPLYQGNKARKKKYIYLTSRHVSQSQLPPKAEPGPGRGQRVWIFQKAPNLVKTE